MKRTILASLLFAMGAFGNASAQQTINLTIGSSHPEQLPWVAAMKNFVVPETNKRLEAAGNRYRINWREAYGGVLYKANATLTEVRRKYGAKLRVVHKHNPLPFHPEAEPAASKSSLKGPVVRTG